MCSRKWSPLFYGYCQGVERKAEGLSYTGINQESVKNYNRSAILKLINDQGAMSRKDIAAALGLTAASVTVICSEMIDNQVLCELGEAREDKRAGRKKILVGINYDRWQVLSISIESAETCISVTNLGGTQGVFKRIKTDTSMTPVSFLHRVADKCKSLMWENSIAKDTLLGAGISVPGEVDRDAGVSLHAYRIWNEPVPVCACLREYLDIPVILENNVHAFAEAELIFGSGKDIENILFIKWGPGVGSSIVIHKKIYDSNRSKNAEIGHFIMKSKGRECRCGRRGCLETFAGTHAMAEQLRNACTMDRMPQLYERVHGDLSTISAQNFTQFLQLKDPVMWQVIDTNVEMLSHSVCNAITMLAPDQVIVYGKMFEQPSLMERFMAHCKKIDKQYNEDYITRSKLSDKIDFVGPLALVVNRLFLPGQIGSKPPVEQAL